MKLDKNIKVNESFNPEVQNDFEQLWQSLAALDEVEAIALGGSRASQSFDQTSDYDLYVYCSAIPDANVRSGLLWPYCQYTEIGNAFWELEDDCTLNNGIDIDIIYRTLPDFEQALDWTIFQCHPSNGYTTCMWHNLEHSRILYDAKGELRSLQQKFHVAYPEALRKNIICQNRRLLSGNLPSYDRQILKAIKRKDLASINHRAAAWIESYMDILFALNRLSHPGEKRMIQFLKEQADLLPEDFESNLNLLFSHLFHDPDQVETILNQMMARLDELLDAQGFLQE